MYFFSKVTPSTAWHSLGADLRIPAFQPRSKVFCAVRAAVTARRRDILVNQSPFPKRLHQYWCDAMRYGKPLALRSGLMRSGSGYISSGQLVSPLKFSSRYMSVRILVHTE